MCIRDRLYKDNKDLRIEAMQRHTSFFNCEPCLGSSIVGLVLALSLIHIYGGLMLTKHGVKTIEFNARFGDPEAEVILPRLKTDFCDVIENIMNHSKTELEWDDRVTLGAVSYTHLDVYKRQVCVPGVM